MEQKLAEFRARRQAKNTVHNEETTVAPMNQAEKVDARPETTSTRDTGRVENTIDSPQKSPTKVGLYSSSSQVCCDSYLFIYSFIYCGRRMAKPQICHWLICSSGFSVFINTVKYRQDDDKLLFGK